MSSLPPPIPPRPSVGPVANPFSQPSNPAGFKSQLHQGDLVKATPVFLIIAIVVAVSSLLLAIFSPSKNIPLAVIGYLLTPLSVMVLMGCDAVSQRKKTSAEPWFVPNPNFPRLLRILAGISLVLSYPHISAIASSISAALAASPWFASTFSWLP